MGPPETEKLLQGKGNIKTKTPPTEWEKIFTDPTSNRGLISKIYKELKKLATTTPDNEIKKWGAELHREFSTKNLKWLKDT